ncbi:hypothetical protein LOZ86_16405 [Pectobacterium parvum]|uniref:hypothetical protein n=1 Tax=Pectobacterium parvum TaxID=2778550 RepID=UPI001E3D20AE|nr:hypothetical protein [Pectobacterium parvum]UFK38492.1 hypothetical protein LOZ86_16405 [Pectobacterium parvum]GKW43265.1 hypothetical protein PEC301879_31230 [Pectobacterium carotovorum subsp. carotovorum]
MDMSFFYINAQGIISKILLLLTLVVLSPHSIADDKKTDANDIHHPTISVGTKSNINEFTYYDDEKNLAKLAEKVSSLNKEKRDAIEILDKVDSFYSKSFNNLLLLITAMIGVVGVVIPLVISSYQTRLIKIQSVSLQENIRGEMDSELLKLKDDIRIENEAGFLELKSNISEVTERIEGEYKSEIENLRAESLARINNSVAGGCLSNGNYNLSALFYFQAGLGYIQCKNHGRLKDVINSLVGNVIPNMSFYNAAAEDGDEYEKFMDGLSSFNTESIYDSDIAVLKSVWGEFLKRNGVRNQ